MLKGIWIRTHGCRSFECVRPFLPSPPFACSFPPRADTQQVALAYGAPVPDTGLLHTTPAVHTPNPNHSPVVPLASPDLRENLSALPATSSSSGAKFHHIFLDVRTVFANIAAPGELVELYFSLFNKSESRYVTEEFCLIFNHNGAPARESEGRFGQMQTLFRDLSQHDVADQIYLVCRIVKNGAVKAGVASSSSSTTPPMGSRGAFRSDSASFDSSMLRSPSVGAEKNAGMLWTDAQGRESLRRPFGCAVLELSQFNKRTDDQDDGRHPQDALDNLEEHQMSIFVPVAESAFSTLHEDIIHSRVKELEKSPRAEHLAVSVRVLHGEIDQLVRDLPAQLEEIPFTSRLGFPDVVFPGDQRNEVYLKLWSGEFSGVGGGGGAGGTGTVRSLAQLAAAGGAGNVEVTAELRARDGTRVERVLSRGAGEPNISTYTSMVYRSNNSPSASLLPPLPLSTMLTSSSQPGASSSRSASRSKRCKNATSSSLSATATSRVVPTLPSPLPTSLSASTKTPSRRTARTTSSSTSTTAKSPFLPFTSRSPRSTTPIARSPRSLPRYRAPSSRSRTRSSSSEASSSRPRTLRTRRSSVSSSGSRSFCPTRSS